MADGKLNALSVMGDDPVGTASDREAVQAALGRLDLLVVQDLFLTKTAEMADVVFPAVSYAEKEGTVTNLEGRLQSLAQSIKPLGDSREDWRIISDLSAKMGSDLGYKSSKDITSEIASTVAGYAGAGPDSIGPDGIVIENIKAGSCEGIKIAPVKSEKDKDYPVQVVSGRDVFLNGSLTAMDEGLLKLSAKPKALLGEAAAKSAGIEDGDEIKVETKNGSVSVIAAVTRRASDNTVIVPFNHPDLDARPLFAGLNAGLPGRVSKA
jgi:predicted molibdopterin-dependent oxidoreductase YjgC